MMVRGSRVAAVVLVVLLAGTPLAAQEEAVAGQTVDQVTRLHLALAVDRLMTAAGKPLTIEGRTRFPADVSPKDQPAVARVLGNGLMMALSLFLPDKPVSFYQVSAVLDDTATRLGLAVPEVLPPLPADVPPEHWAAERIRRCLALKLLPLETSFDGGRILRRADLDAALGRLAELGGFQSAWKASGAAPSAGGPR